MPELRVPKPEAPQYAPLEGAAPQQEYQQSAGPQLGPEAKLPPIDNKDGLTVTTALQLRLIREADMLKHLE